MNIFPCEHPTRLFDPIKGEFRYVPCGKCNTCRKHRVQNWINRLKDESLHWPFVYFFTLTYDEQNVPRLVLSKDKTYLNDLKNDTFVSLQELRNMPEWDSSEEEYIQDNDSLTYPVVRHIQLFMKRVRKAVIKCNSIPYGKYKSGKKQGLPRYKRGTFKNEQIRYFIVSEFGSTCFRCHYHGILFFRSRKTAENIEKILSSCWPYGRIDVSRQRHDVASYVAKYVNSVVDMPKVYTHKSIRPFFLCSKYPFIGSLSFTEEKVRQIFNSLSSKRTIVDWRQQLVDVPHPRTLEVQLFPKIQRFDNISYSNRVALYGVARFSRAATFEEFAKWCVKECRQRRYPLTENIKWITHNFASENALLRLYYISSQVCLQCQIFNVSLHEYVKKIEDYYRLKDFTKLKDFYSQLEKQPVDPRCLIAVDGSLRDRLPSMTYLQRQLLFESYGFTSPSYDVDSCIALYDKFASSDANILVYLQESESRFFHRDMEKTKLKKDYLFKNAYQNRKMIEWHKSKGHFDILNNYT